MKGLLGFVDPAGAVEEFGGFSADLDFVLIHPLFDGGPAAVEGGELVDKVVAGFLGGLVLDSLAGGVHTAFGVVGEAEQRAV